MIIRSFKVEIKPSEFIDPSSGYMVFSISVSANENKFYTYEQVVPPNHFKSVFSFLFDQAKYEIEKYFLTEEGVPKND